MSRGNIQEFQVVDLMWSERRRIHYDAASRAYVLDKADTRLSKTGVYCIYGRHPVYGPDVLLYIGITSPNDLGTRSFENRLRDHLGSRFWYHQDLSYATGISDPELSRGDNEMVESILIAAHKPALNRDSIDCAKAGCEKLLVRNWDFPGSLQFECSGAYWCGSL